MRIDYLQKMLLPRKAWHVVSGLTLVGNLLEDGLAVRFFPGGSPMALRRLLKEASRELGFGDNLARAACCIPIAHKGLYGAGFRLSSLRSIASADVVLAGSLKEAFWGLRAKVLRHSDAPICFEVMHLISRLKGGKLSRRLYEMEKLVFSRADLIIYPSESLRKFCDGYLPSPRNSIVVPTGYNDRIIGPVSAPLDSSDAMHIAFLGTLDEGSGVDALIAAMESLPEQYKLTVLGDSPERRLQDLRAMLRSRGLGSRVCLPGMPSMSELRAYMEQCSMVVIPTETSTEHFSPMSLYEAIGFGMPLVATPVPALREHLQDGVNALFTSEMGGKALARTIKLLGSNADLQRAMREANRAKGTTLTASSAAATLEDAFARLVKA